MSVPNQKTIYIQRTSNNVRKDYLKVSNTNLFSAMYNLKPNAFKLWIYFLDNADGYRLDLYPVDFINKANVARSTYDMAFKQLQEKGYLIQSEVKDNLYIFKEQSDLVEKPDLISSIDKEQFNDIKKKYF